MQNTNQNISQNSEERMDDNSANDNPLAGVLNSGNSSQDEDKNRMQATEASVENIERD